ncbi:hypothetical protein Q8F55_003487 [Vanrija albida]|uniref:BTB domain-containing protein n=1 Tax=Vanrija albida TaxID=181172 RepID=A0ABR3Q445_9TREE
MPTAVAVPHAPVTTPFHPPAPTKPATPRPLDVLVSADGVSFPVDRQALSSQSAVLRDLLSAQQPGRSRLPLPEQAADLAPFLDILLHDADPFADLSDVLSALPAIRLMAKYDTPQRLTYAVTTLKCHVMEGAVCPLQVFIVGAALGDGFGGLGLDLCRTAIVHGDVPTAHPSAQALVAPFWDTVDPAYKAALTASWAESDDPKARGNKFIQIMSHLA